MIKNKELETFKGINIEEYICPIICVYDKPNDYPDAAVARIFDMTKATDAVLVKNTVNELREDIQESFPYMIKFTRANNDPQSIAETWI